MSEPIKVQVTRYQCPHCGWKNSRRKKTVEHIARCWVDPAKKTCRSCTNSTWPYGDHCRAGIFLDPLANQPVMDCPSWTDADQPDDD